MHGIQLHHGPKIKPPGHLFSVLRRQIAVGEFSRPQKDPYLFNLNVIRRVYSFSLIHGEPVHTLQSIV